jgi:capsid protein
MFIDRVVDRWISDAILTGMLRPRAEGYAREYVMPMVEPIDPLKDLQADILAVRAGRMSPQDFIESWGRPTDDVMSEFESFFADIDARGMVFDIDPRRQTKAGTAQPVPGNGANQPNEDTTP